MSRRTNKFRIYRRNRRQLVPSSCRPESSSHLPRSSDCRASRRRGNGSRGSPLTGVRAPDPRRGPGRDRSAWAILARPRSGLEADLFAARSPAGRPLAAPAAARPSPRFHWSWFRGRREPSRSARTRHGITRGQRAERSGPAKEYAVCAVSSSVELDSDPVGVGGCSRFPMLTRSPGAVHAHFCWSC